MDSEVRVKLGKYLLQIVFVFSWYGFSPLGCRNFLSPREGVVSGERFDAHALQQQRHLSSVCSVVQTLGLQMVLETPLVQLPLAATGVGVGWRKFRQPRGFCVGHFLLLSLTLLDYFGDFLSILLLFFLRCFLYAVVTLRAVDGYLLWIRN